MDRDDPWPAQTLLLWFAYPDRSYLQGIILVAFNTWYDDMGYYKDDKTKQKHAQESIQYIEWPHGGNERISSHSASIVLLVLVSRSLSLPMLADRSFLTGGNLWCCSCIRLSPEVCSNGVVSPPICAFCCCFLLPKYRQFEMTIGEF